MSFESLRLGRPGSSRSARKSLRSALIRFLLIGTGLNLTSGKSADTALFDGSSLGGLRCRARLRFLRRGGMRRVFIHHIMDNHGVFHDGIGELEAVPSVPLMEGFPSGPSTTLVRRDASSRKPCLSCGTGSDALFWLAVRASIAITTR